MSADGWEGMPVLAPSRMRGDTGEWAKMGLLRCGSGKEPFVDLECVIVETNEVHEFDTGACDVGIDGGNGDAGGAFGREAVDARANGRKGDGANLVLGGEVETAAIAAGEQLVFVLRATMPDGPDGVKDPLGRKMKAGRGFGVAGGTAMQLAAGGEEFRTSGAVNCAIDPSTAEKRGIGCVDDCIDVEAGDVARNRDELGHRLVQLECCRCFREYSGMHTSSTSHRSASPRKVSGLALRIAFRDGESKRTWRMG